MDNPRENSSVAYFNCNALGGCHIDTDVFAQLVAQQLSVVNLRATYLRDVDSGLEFFAYIGASTHGDFIVLRDTDIALYRGSLTDVISYLKM